MQHVDVYGIVLEKELPAHAQQLRSIARRKRNLLTPLTPVFGVSLMKKLNTYSLLQLN
jgi:hypothetical protein